MTILEVENIKVSYSNHIALENINFKIEEGEYVCLVGENGILPCFCRPDIIISFEVAGKFKSFKFVCER